MGAIAKHGDPTTTGGYVFARDTTQANKGTPLLLDGDGASCGNCPGTWQVIGTCENMTFHGRKAVQDGDLITCPCRKNRVIAISTDMYYSRGNASVASASSPKGVPIDALEANTDDDDDDVEVIEQGFVLLEGGTTPAEGYHYDLYSNGLLHTQKGFYSNGRTVGVQGNPVLKLVTWIAKDSASKSYE